LYAIEPFLPLRFILINGQSAKVPHFLVWTLRPHPHLSSRLLLSSRSSQMSPLQAQGLWLSGTLQCLHQHGFQYQTLSLHLSHTLRHVITVIQDLILTPPHFPHTCQSPFRRILHSRHTFLPTGPFRVRVCCKSPHIPGPKSLQGGISGLQSALVAQSPLLSSKVWTGKPSG
jgi:hypothetical protein